MSSYFDLSVVICSLNGAAGVDCCLRALAGQKDVNIQVIVVDDGSTDDTSEVARQHGVLVIRHEVNRGLAAARNTGISSASAPIVAFLDDDCEPEPTWARELLAAYEDERVIGAGGDVIPCAPHGFMLGYLKRNNPLLPLELNLGQSGNLLFRLYLYILRKWTPGERHDKRDVYSLVGANMSFRLAALTKTNFDERFRFGGEDLDICLSMSRDFPGTRLRLNPDAQVRHHFKASLGDTLRRSRSYGRGGARIHRKWSSIPPTILPGPLLMITLIAVSPLFPGLLIAALLLPQLMYFKGPKLALSTRNLACLLDAYVQLAQETTGNVGCLEGMWQFRNLAPEPSPDFFKSHGPRDGTSAEARL